MDGDSTKTTPARFLTTNCGSAMARRWSRAQKWLWKWKVWALRNSEQTSNATLLPALRLPLSLSLSLCTALAGLCPPVGRAGDDSAVLDWCNTCQKIWIGGCHSKCQLEREYHINHQPANHKPSIVLTTNFPVLSLSQFLQIVLRISHLSLGRKRINPKANQPTHCWWKKSCTIWDVKNPVNNPVNYLSSRAEFLPSTVVPQKSPGLVEQKHTCFPNMLWMLSSMPFWEAQTGSASSSWDSDSRGARAWRTPTSGWIRCFGGFVAAFLGLHLFPFQTMGRSQCL